MNEITKKAIHRIRDLSEFLIKNQYDLDLNIIMYVEQLKNEDLEYFTDLTGVFICNLDSLLRGYINILEVQSEEDRILLLAQLKYFVLGYRKLLNADGTYNKVANLNKLKLHTTQVKDLMSSPNFNIGSFFNSTVGVDKDTEFGTTLGFYLDILIRDLELTLKIFHSGLDPICLPQIIEKEFKTIYNSLKDYSEKRLVDFLPTELVIVHKIVNEFAQVYAQKIIGGTTWELPQSEYYHCSKVNVMSDSEEKYYIEISGRYFSLKTKERTDFDFKLPLQEFLGFEPKQIDSDEYFEIEKNWRKK